LLNYIFFLISKENNTWREMLWSHPLTHSFDTLQSYLATSSTLLYYFTFITFYDFNGSSSYPTFHQLHEASFLQVLMFATTHPSLYSSHSSSSLFYSNFLKISHVLHYKTWQPLLQLLANRLGSWGTKYVPWW